MNTECLYNGQFLGIKSNNLVKYTEDECNKLNGTWNTSGECLKKNGGSYSYECRNYTPSVTNPVFNDSNNESSGWSSLYIYPILLLIVSLILIIFTPRDHDATSSLHKGLIIIPLTLPLISFLCICGLCIFCGCLQPGHLGSSFGPQGYNNFNSRIGIQFIVAVIVTTIVISYTVLS